jgi:hypothetical protein
MVEEEAGGQWESLKREEVELFLPPRFNYFFTASQRALAPKIKSLACLPVMPVQLCKSTQ